MSFNNFCEILQLDFTCEILLTAVRPKTIWILRSNFELDIFERSNLKNVKKYMINQKPTKDVKMCVDSKGEKCIIIIARKKPLYFTTTAQTFQVVPIPPSVIPLTGCWIEPEKSLPSFLLGDEKGQILHIQPGSNVNPTFLYRSPNGTPIIEIATMTIKSITYFVIYTDEKVITYSGSERIEIIFASGASPHIIFVGLPKEIQKNRIFPQNLSNKIGILIDYGALILHAFESGNKANFQQDLCEFNSPTKSYFAQTPYGILFADSTGIPVVYEGKARLTVPLPEVNYIYTDENEYIFTTSGDIIRFTIDKFKQFLCRTAIDQKDFEYANMLIRSDNSIIQPVINTLQAKKANEFLNELELSINRGLQIFTKPEIKISFLCGKLARMPYRMIKDRYALAWFILSLFLSVLPQKIAEFKAFLQANLSLFPRQSLEAALYQTYYEDAPILLAELYGDVSKAIDFYMQRGDYEKAIEKLSDVNDQNTVVNILLRIPRQDLVRDFILNHSIDATKLIPILSLFHSIAPKSIGAQSRTPMIELLLILSHCINKDIQALNTAVTTRSLNLEKVISLSICFKLFEPASRALVRLGMINRAIATAHKGGLNLAYQIINTIKSDLQKSAWMALLGVCSDEERSQIIRRIIDSKMFEFEELLPFIGDDEPICNFSDRIKQAVEKLQFEPNESVFQRKFRNPQIDAFVLHLGDTCASCHKVLQGTEFIHFPCGHSMHQDCLQTMYKKLKEPFGKNGYLDSCPLCGFGALTSDNWMIFV